MIIISCVRMSIIVKILYLFSTDQLYILLCRFSSYYSPKFARNIEENQNTKDINNDGVYLCKIYNKYHQIFSMIKNHVIIEKFRLFLNSLGKQNCQYFLQIIVLSLYHVKLKINFKHDQVSHFWNIITFYVIET